MQLNPMAAQTRSDRIRGMHRCEGCVGKIVIYLCLIAYRQLSSSGPVLVKRNVVGFATLHARFAFLPIEERRPCETG
jgi:hypothetical protein